MLGMLQTVWCLEFLPLFVVVRSWGWLRHILTAACVQPYISAANNACWALGLLATALPGEAVAPLVASAAERMLHVLKAAGGSVQRRLRENAAISVGRLATVQPSALAVHLSHFLGDWCVTLATITVRVLRPPGPLNPALVPVKILTSFS